MERHATTATVTAGILSILLAACAVPTGEPPPDVGSPVPGALEPSVAADPGEVADRAVEDVSAFWEQAYPRVYGGAFVPVAGFHPYGPDTPPPPCGSPPPRYEDIADNAFYCPSDDIVAWDEAELLPDLNERFGGFTVAIVIAHEFGHAIQDRIAAFDRTVDLELQADCFAGAWAGHVAGGASGRFAPDEVDLDHTVAGMLAIRDQPGTSPDDPFAHGSGFDRIAAFQDGYESGAGQCAAYADRDVDRRTAEIELHEGDLGNGGNLPLEDGPAAPEGVGLLSRLQLDLNDFYDRLFRQLGAPFTPVDGLVLVDPDRDAIDCDGERLAGRSLERATLYCADQATVVLDGERVRELDARIGDFAAAAEVARLWAVAAQTQLGVAEAQQAGLQADCLTGRWAAWTFPAGPGRGAESDELVMSAGDLDEGIEGFLYSVREGLSVFDRTTALRTGFFGSHRDCEAYGPLG